MLKKTVISIAMLLAASSTAFAQNDSRPVASPTLPGGATTLQETFQDWTVTCAVMNNKKLCNMSQQQTQQNGQRILAMELTSEGGVTQPAATLVLPFGLLLDDGFTYQVDDKGTAQKASFKTCFPGGCLATINLTPEMTQSMRSGAALKLVAKTADNGQNFNLNVSLKGFGSALDRMNTLSK